ncbi:hypothetical protein C7S20_11255 [Christiangramia fulva]|uniref:Uncharacterized protein n=1 Tax=Christiangramia fulva TaxID=2126553 RepID=A0A2R3Z698_9FLAO|nr:hypothetical protein [Christiangramia fulva]AVR45780.1 hypothetical protein C7S20_11255 [Christiangramia fulva]
MKLKFPRTNIESRLINYRNKSLSPAQLMAEVDAAFKEVDNRDSQVIENIENGHEVGGNNFDFDKLDTNRIFHLKHIHKICIDYRLRFLDSKFFKGEIPYEALTRIKTLEKEHDIELKGFKIVAPSKLFKLENADDPLLFAPMGNNYYYLVHKWGNDLHPFRKILMWPFKTLENYMCFLLVLSFLTAFILPDNLFTPHQTTIQFLIIFFFVFKWFAGLSIFYGFKKGKNFNTAIWDSKFYNA